MHIQTYFTLYYAYGYTIVMAVGPVLILIILNTIIVVALRSYSKGNFKTLRTIIRSLFIGAKVPTITTSDDNNNDGANTPADDGTKTDVIFTFRYCYLFLLQSSPEITSLKAPNEIGVIRGRCYSRDFSQKFIKSALLIIRGASYFSQFFFKFQSVFVGKL